MALKRAILELGAGTALHSRDYTKAAVRAVQDALYHASLSFVKALEIDPATMNVHVTVGVQRPERVDTEAVLEALPHGRVIATVCKGGLDVPDAGSDDLTVIATAAIAVHIDVPETEASG